MTSSPVPYLLHEFVALPVGGDMAGILAVALSMREHGRRETLPGLLKFGFGPSCGSPLLLRLRRAEGLPSRVSAPSPNPGPTAGGVLSARLRVRGGDAIAPPVNFGTSRA